MRVAVVMIIVLSSYSSIEETPLRYFIYIILFVRGGMATFSPSDLIHMAVSRCGNQIYPLLSIVILLIVTGGRPMCNDVFNLPVLPGRRAIARNPGILCPKPEISFYLQQFAGRAFHSAPADHKMEEWPA
jgi:hypothetical protein